MTNPPPRRKSQLASGPTSERLRYVAARMNNVEAFRDAVSSLALALFELRDETDPCALGCRVASDLRISINEEARTMGSDLSQAQLDEIAGAVRIAALDMATLMHNAGSA